MKNFKGSHLPCPVCGSDCRADKVLRDNEARAALIEALMLARRRIDYLGAVCFDPKHSEANDKTYLPKIDAALAAVGGVPK